MKSALRSSEPPPPAAEWVEVKPFPSLGIHVAVASAPNPAAYGAPVDVGLGLGCDDTEKGAITKATGEALERFGAAAAGVTASPRTPLFDMEGNRSGDVSSAHVFLPYAHDKQRLPATSEGLAFGSSWAEAARRSLAELTERLALEQVIKQGGLVRHEGPSSSRLPLTTYKLPTAMAVHLSVLSSPHGDVLAAGLGASNDPQASLRKAALETSLAHLCREGAVLPSMFEGRETLLSRFGITRLSHLERLVSANAPVPPLPQCAFALACPIEWTYRNAYVVRAVRHE